jgi:hypothetical protein
MGQECSGYGGAEPGEFTLVYCALESPGGVEQVPCTPDCREWLFHFNEGVLVRTVLQRP